MYRKACNLASVAALLASAALAVNIYNGSVIKKDYEKQLNDLRVSYNAAVDKSSELQTSLNILIDNYPAYNPTNATYLGLYQCTAYCSEEYTHICGTGDGITASGAHVTPGVTVAADKSIPFGTVLYIEDVGIRIVQDRGGAIKGERIDVAIDTHSNALEWDGYGTHEVWVISWGDEQ